MRLVALNTAALLIIMNIFGAVIYFHVQYRLNNQVDETLINASKHLQDKSFNVFIHEKEENQEEINERIVYLLWNKQGDLVKIYPEEEFSRTDLSRFKNALQQPQLQTVDSGQHHYRVIRVPLSGKNAAQTLQLVYNLDPEQNMLQNLLLVIGIGNGVSLLLAVLTGLFLADKALVPIRLAWEKQQRFVADASHELRTPLASIKIHLERLFRNPGHTIEQESENIYEVINETERMRKLVANLLTLARSDSNELQILVKKIRLDRICERVLSQFQELAQIRNIRLDSKIIPVEMEGDGERLQQLLVILLDNALKYGKDGGTITVGCRRIRNTAVLEVKDTGVGIRKKDLPFIFDRFYRGDQARTRSGEGTGLGLSIAKWIVEAHGGKIKVESEWGVGTRFLIQLPLKNKNASLA